MNNHRLDIARDDAPAAPAATLVIVDPRVADADALLQGLDPAAIVVRLDAGADGLAQMAAALQAHPGATAVHVLAHGDAGQLWLGNTFLDAASLQAHASDLAQLGAALAPGGDILLYACELAQGDAGAAFVGTLAALTGADVAASDDRTGTGGDWDLEISTGTVDAALPLAAQALQRYDHALATITVTTNADSGAGSLRSAIAAAVAGDTITFNAGMTVTLTSGQLSIAKNLTIDGDLDDNGTPDVTLDGNSSSRVINVTAGTVQLDGLVITHGKVAGSGGGSNSGAGGDALGAAINNAGTLTLQHSTVTANKAGGGGGGGGSGGTSGSAGGGSSGSSGGGFGGSGGTASNGTVSVGGGGGGAGYDFAGGRGGHAAGGIYNSGTLTILGSTVSSNVAAGGGGGGGSDYSGSAGSGGAGGNAAGAIWNAGGTLRMDSSSYATTSTGNVASAGNGGGARYGGAGSNGSAVGRILTTGGGSTITNYSTDTTPPTASITMSDVALRVGDTALVTITFSEAVTGFTNADLSVASGTLSSVSSSDGGTTWTATFTPTSGVTDSTNVIALTNTGVQDAAGNAGSGTTNSPNYSVDTQRPTASLAFNDSALSVGETATLTITFSEAVSGFTVADLAVPNGAVSNLSSSDGGTTWTATFTPTANTQDSTNVVTLDNTGVSDAAGNAGSGSTDSGNVAVDTLRPTATLTMSDTALRVGETATLTVTFSEAVTGFTNADLSLANGTLTPVSSSDGGITWTATFTPTANVDDATNLITLANSGVADGAGNVGSGTSSTPNVAIDTLRPTATLVMADTQLTSGETSALTITFSEAVSGFTNADLTVDGGTLSSVSSGDGGVTWTATFTPTASTSDASNVVTLDNTGVVDAAGNAGSGATASNNYVVATQALSATLSLSDSALALGETSLLTVTFSEAVSGFSNADLTVANGTLSTVSSSDGGVTWTATLTPAASVQDATNVVTLDNTGVTSVGSSQAGVGTTDSGNYAVDTARPTATLGLDDSALGAGDTATLTVTFSEAVSGFTNADLSVANGTLSSVSSSDGGTTWTATFTPTAGVQDATNVITLDDTGVADAAGNAGSGSSDSANYAIDTLRPTATLSLSTSTLKAGETATLTIAFSEAASGLTTADLVAENGQLAGLASSDGGITWTATLTPTSGITDSTNAVTLDLSGVQDAAGNAGTGTSSSPNVAIDTLRPGAVLALDQASLAGSATATLTITFSEAVSGLDTADFSAPNGALSGLASGDGGVTWTATFTPTAGVSDASNVITLNGSGVTDAAGNSALSGASSGNVAIDTLGPQARIVVADTLLRSGQTTRVTISFDEAVTGFSNADLTVANGTLSAVSSADGGSTWTATLTPAADCSDDTNAITLANAGVSDAQGNAGAGSSVSNNYVVATTRTPPANPDAQDDLVDGTPVLTRTTHGSDGSAQTVVQVPVVQPGRQDDAGSAHEHLADIPLAHDSHGLVTLTGGVPAGVGLSLFTLSGSPLGPLAQVLAAYGEVTAPPMPLSGLVQAWLGSQVPGSLIAVHTLGFSGGTGSGTVLINGGGDLPQALVIDARGLPPTGALQLDNVDFAAVVGPVHMVGGAGNNVLLADGAQQFLVLGQGDDELHGGDGNDTVASRGGNDRLFGDGGDDHVVGGVGDDTLQGGSGNDVLQGGASDAGRWTVRLDAQGTLQTSFQVAERDLAEQATLVLQGPWGPAAWADQADPRLAFGYQGSERLQLVTLLHQAALDRLPTLAELNAYASSALSDAQLAQAAWHLLLQRHPDWPQGTPGQQVAGLIEAVWGPGTASDAAVATGLAYLQAGGTWSDGLLALAQAAAARALHSDDLGRLLLAQPWDAGELGLGAGSGNDNLYGGAGDDRLVGGDGDDRLDGGDGIDTAVYAGRPDDYRLWAGSASGSWQVQDLVRGGTDTLVDVERLEIGGELFTPAPDHVVPLVGVAGG